MPLIRPTGGNSQCPPRLPHFATSEPCLTPAGMAGRYRKPAGSRAETAARLDPAPGNRQPDTGKDRGTGTNVEELAG